MDCYEKILCLCMAGITALTGLAGCAGAPAETVPATTEVTQSPEEAAVYKVLLIGQSLGLEKLEDVKVDVIGKNLRATSREQKFGDLEITQEHKDALIASVNFALANPNQVPEQTARPAAILEPEF